MNAAATDYRHDDETPGERLVRKTRAFLAHAARIAVWSALITPVFLVSFLTLDLPMAAFDGFTGGNAVLRAQNFLSVGAFLMSVATLLLLFAARRRGADEASRVAITSWVVAAIATFVELSILAPQLSPGDLPSPRFAGAFMFSWLIGQLVAVHIYDLTRGGRWWRAPLFGGLWGLFIQAALYFPLVYLGSGAPWPNWLVSDMMLKTLLVTAFLPIYAGLRKRIAPVRGLGGA